MASRTSCPRVLPALLGALLVTVGDMRSTHAAQEEKSSPQADLFASDAPLQIVINAPWREVTRKRRQAEATDYPATLEYTDAAGRRRVLDLEVEQRGLTRLRVCAFPPIRLRFAGKAAAGTVFAGKKSLKMVTHCGNGERWEQYYVKEMLAYRIYNLVTERSFRVRPLRVTYHDNGKGASNGPHFAFLIEDDGDVAKRNGLKKVPVVEISPTQLQPLESARFALFQYLIGNTDWAALSGPKADKCCHNARLLGHDARTDIYAVPYDFDASGLVNASYAVPSESLSIGSVTERLYRGFCVHNPMLESARAEYLGKEQAILGLVRDESRLTARNKQAALAYVGEFFEVLRNPKQFATQVTAKCRK